MQRVTQAMQTNNNRVFDATLVIVVCLVFAAGCASTKSSSLTPGMAKKHIRPGVTSQAEVIEVFGSPNIITHRDGGEMWVYDKVSSRTTSGVFGIGVGAGGGSVGGIGGGGVGSTERSETTVMLIIYYDKNDIVRDYKITQTKF